MSVHCFFKEYYGTTIVPALKRELSFSNVHCVPKFEKVVINSGIRSSTDKLTLDRILGDIGKISGQRPIFTLAKKSISNFKVREGMPVGVKVTLRGRLMYEFLYKLIHIVLPGVRDFRGLPSRLDGCGNYTIGLVDHTVFPEIKMDAQVKQNVGMDITVVTTASNDEHGKLLLELAGIPFRKS